MLGVIEVCSCAQRGGARRLSALTTHAPPFAAVCLTLHSCSSRSFLQKKIKAKALQTPALVCRRILNELMGDARAAVFMEPLNAKKLGLHDYHTMIKEPMDLGTVDHKLSNGLYKNLASLGDEFHKDVLLTFNNALLYNYKGDEVWEHANGLKNTFQARWPKFWAKTQAPESLGDCSRSEDGAEAGNKVAEKQNTKSGGGKKSGGGRGNQVSVANVPGDSCSLTCKFCFNAFASMAARNGHMRHCRMRNPEATSSNTAAKLHQGGHQGKAAPSMLASADMLKDVNKMRDRDMLDQVPALPLACVLEGPR